MVCAKSHWGRRESRPGRRHAHRRRGRRLRVRPRDGRGADRGRLRGTRRPWDARSHDAVDEHYVCLHRHDSATLGLTSWADRLAFRSAPLNDVADGPPAGKCPDVLRYGTRPAFEGLIGVSGLMWREYDVVEPSKTAVDSRRKSLARDFGPPDV